MPKKNEKRVVQPDYILTTNKYSAGTVHGTKKKTIRGILNQLVIDVHKKEYPYNIVDIALSEIQALIDGCEVTKIESSMCLANYPELKGKSFIDKAELLERMGR